MCLETREKSGKAEVSENVPVQYVAEKDDLASQEHRGGFVATVIDLLILHQAIRLTYTKNMDTGNIQDWDGWIDNSGKRHTTAAC